MKKLRQIVQRLKPSNVSNGQIGSIDLNIWLAQLAGLPLIGIKKEETKSHRIIKQILGLLMLIALFCYVILELYDLKRSWTNLDMLTQNLVMTLTHLGYWFKVINTYFHYETIKNIIQKLRYLTKNCVVSENQQRIFYETEIKNKLVMLMYCHLITVPPLMALFMIMLAPEGFAGERFPFRMKTPDFLPLHLQHLYMGICLVYISAGLSVIDILHVLFMNHVCLHLKILNLAFEELISGSDRNNYNQMISIVKYHCELIVLRQEMEHVYRLPVMFQFISSLIIVAMTAFQAIVGDVSQSTFLMDFLLTCLIVQLFIYCWYGNEVFEQSKTLSTSGFSCDWYKFNGKFRKTLLIFMINAERPFLFTAGGFMGLTLASFTNIMGKSYSIVAVLSVIKYLVNALFIMVYIKGVRANSPLTLNLYCKMEKLLVLTQRLIPSVVSEGKLGSIELNIWLAQLMGLPLIGFKSETKFQFYRIIIIGLIVLPSLFCYVIMELYDLLLNWHDLDVVTQNLVMSLTHLGYWFKVFNTYYYYDVIRSIVAKLSQLTRSYITTDKQIKTFYQSETANKLVCLIYFGMVAVPSTMAFIMLLIIPEDLAGQRFPYRVRIPSFFPTILQYLYMGISIILISCGTTTIDYVNMLFMNHICMHLKMLNMAFLNLDKDTKIESSKQLIAIIKYHCDLITLRQQLEEIYRLPIMYQFVSSLVIVAMTAFQAIVGDGSSSSILIDFLLSCVIAQLFLYCWYGNEVVEESKTLSTSGFGCNWYTFDSKFKRLLLIFMINAERPFLFTAGGFMGLTLTSFGNIMSKSYSIVAVLRQVYSKT